MSRSSGLEDPHLAFREHLLVATDLWPRIALLEISLRNKLADEISNRLGPMFFQLSNRIVDERLSLRIQQLQSRSARTRDQVVSQLSLGFWALLLNKRYESSLWAPVLRHAFANLGSVSRGEISTRLARIVRIRNRIAHHENVLGVNIEKLVQDIDWLLERLHKGASGFYPMADTFPLHPVE